MLKDMQLWTEVRHALLVEQISLREAAERFDLNFRTVQKIRDNVSPPDYVRGSRRAPTKLQAFLPFIEEYLAEDAGMSPKQRHTAQRIYDRLREEHGYSGSDRAIRYVVEKLRRREEPLFIPLSHPRGHSQFDFGFAEAILGGVRQQVAYAVLSLPYSNVRYVQAFPRECTETFQEALKRAFSFLGGVPREIKFDNSKVNVGKIIGRRGEEPSLGLLQLESHYLFKHDFCYVYEPQEKGHAENAIGYVRRNFMVPIPEFRDFAAFNEYLERKCREEYAKTSAREEKTIGELFSEERAALLPLPDVEFESRRLEIHRANSLSLVRFDRNDYSVPGEQAHKEFTVVGGIDTVRFLVEGECVAVHERDWGRNGTHYNPIHYLAIAEKRPNGLDFGAPFAEWQLPKEFDLLRRRLESKAGKQGKREYIRILRLFEHFSVDQLSRGIARALASNTTAYEGVRLYVQCAAEVSVELFSLDGRPHLQYVPLPVPDLNVYSTLMENHADEETRNETDGAVEASLDATENADDGAGLRGDRGPLRDGERGPSRIPATTRGAGIIGSGSEGGPAAAPIREIPEPENPGRFRLPGPAVDQHDAGESVDARGVHRQSGCDHPDRSTGDRQDALGDGLRRQGLSGGPEGEVLPGERSDHATARSAGGEDAAAHEKDAGVA